MAIKLSLKKGSLDPKNILPTVFIDSVRRVHFRSAPLESYAAYRFSKIIDATLKGEIYFPSQASRIGWSLIIFDAVATKPDLENAIANLDSVFRWRDHVCLDWLNAGGSLQRRYLSPFTQAALAAPRTEKVTTSKVLDEIAIVLTQLFPDYEGAYDVPVLLSDALAWLREHISDPVYAHVSGLVPMTSLHKSALARAESGLALVTFTDESQEVYHHQGFQVAIAAYLDQNNDDSGSWLVSEIKRICQRNKSASNSDDKKRMLKECLALASHASESGPISGLILAWVIDLLESGTRRKQVLKAITPAKYVSAAANLLLTTFKGKVLEEISASTYFTTYKGLLDGLSSSKARTLASAIGSWHFFISTWFDVEPLWTSLHKWVPPVPPKANIVWPHETKTVRTWLETIGSDERSHAQLSVAFEILSGMRIRANELLTLRKQNVKVIKNVAHIEIATHSRDGGNKSPAAQHPGDIFDPVAVKLIENWLKRRTEEGAYPGDYFFGDPYRADKKYRSGHLYISLNQLLKSATGDPTIASHALSHTFVSFSWLAAARAPQHLDINPFEERAAATGHESPHTGFSTYFHFPEVLLREDLDKAIAAQMDRWPSVAPHVAMTHAGFRQARSRQRQRNSGLTDGVIALNFVQRANPTLLTTEAAHDFDFIVPESPLRAKASTSLTLSCALDLLNDIQAGHSAKAIALRSNITSESVYLLANCVTSTLQKIGEIPRQWVASSNGDALIALSKILSPTTCRSIDFRRTGQEKVAFLYDQLSRNLASEIAKSGIASWRSCYQKGYLSLEKPSLAADFIRLLDTSDFPRSRMVIRAQADLSLSTKATIEAIFHTGIAAMPKGELIKNRYGRPSAYLALTSTPSMNGEENLFRNAALGMTGINALMLAASACNLFNEQKQSASTGNEGKEKND
ncbi:hypothetical protein [Dechloromonas sp. HYN0024]|uniref:hypothetical protein n=1 Tax=Dechloromonas sp. HYN0024 TaxID=2231055 RepID=UPI000E43DE58|nr:hypothetical protein [Dechloromonas sp. HYN0024]AXS79108.1 hypothetical protein HYN24_03095 [Dechloromonas sp. HYN0024]